MSAKFGCACLPLSSRSSAAADHLPAKSPLRLSALIQPFLCPRQITCRQKVHCACLPLPSRSSAAADHLPAKFGYACLPLSSRSSVAADHLPATSPLRLSAFIQSFLCRGGSPAGNKSAAPVCLYPVVPLPRRITCRQKIRYARLPLSSRSSAAADHLPATSPLRLSAFIQPFLCRG
ncbi:hypothetical protein ACVNS2_09165 [Paenibacillus caseinilyticus]|uniref:hypothetical protein n=1 Tax=Paenibacillus mucilaginosus TaxID=61624 RepID=UPI000FFE64AC|nr:hypothetical protein [Paenibacillus mucilaginosus]